MAEIYVIAGSDAIENVAQALKPFIGEQADYCNYLPLVEVTLEMMFYGYVMCAEGTSKMMIQRWGATEEQAQVIADQLVYDLRIPITRILPNGIELNHSYNFTVTMMGDIELMDLGESGPPESPLKKELDVIVQDLDDGDWYPERTRRMVGR